MDLECRSNPDPTNGLLALSDVVQFPWLKEPSSDGPAFAEVPLNARGISLNRRQLGLKEEDRFLDQLAKLDSEPDSASAEIRSLKSRTQTYRSARNFRRSNEKPVFCDQDDDDNFIMGLECLIQTRFSTEAEEKSPQPDKANERSKAAPNVITECDAYHASIQRPADLLRKERSPIWRQDVPKDVSDVNHSCENLSLSQSALKERSCVRGTTSTQGGPGCSPHDVMTVRGSQNATSDQIRMKANQNIERKLLRYSCIPPCCLLPQHKSSNTLLLTSLASHSPEFANCQDFLDLRSTTYNDSCWFQCLRIAKVFSYRSHSGWARFRKQLSTDYMPLSRMSSNIEYEVLFHTSDNKTLAEILDFGFQSQGEEYCILCHDLLTESHIDMKMHNETSRRVLICHAKTSRKLLADRPVEALRRDYKDLRQRSMASYDCIIVQQGHARCILMLSPANCTPLYLVEYKPIQIKAGISPSKSRNITK